MADVEKMKHLASYLLDNGVQVVALAPNLKYPIYKDWQKVRLTKEQIFRAIDKNHGLGIKPNNDFIVVDLDSDHGDYDGVSNFTDNFEDMRTLTATKPNSQNQHRFYKNTYDLDIRLTGNQAVLKGVDIFSRDNQVRALPAYDFINLDFTRPFIEQMSDAPERFELLKYYERKTETYKRKGKHNIKKYLDKVEPFGEGSRSENYRKLVFVMVVKNGMDYDEVKTAIDEWDLTHGDFQHDEPSQYEHATREPM